MESQNGGNVKGEIQKSGGIAGSDPRNGVQLISRSETDISGQYWEISEGFSRPKNNFLTEFHLFYFKRALIRHHYGAP